VGDQAAPKRGEDRNVACTRVGLGRHERPVVHGELPAQTQNGRVEVEVLPAQAQASLTLMPV
jgi:hypothetical protein